MQHTLDIHTIQQLIEAPLLALVRTHITTIPALDWENTAEPISESDIARLQEIAGSSDFANAQRALEASGATNKKLYAEAMNHASHVEELEQFEVFNSLHQLRQMFEYDITHIRLDETGEFGWSTEAETIAAILRNYTDSIARLCVALTKTEAQNIRARARMDFAF